MASNDRYESPKPTAGDHLHTLARAGIGSIPIVGAAAEELLGLLIAPPLEKRRRKWMESVGEGLRALEQERSLRLEDLRTNEAFIDTVAHASQAALRNSQQDKVDALRNAVLNAALPNPPEESIQQIFVSLVDTSTVWHLRILRLLDDPPRWFVENGRGPLEPATGSLANLLEIAYPDMRGQRSLYDKIVTDLYSSGLIGLDSLHVVMSGGGSLSSRSTALGKQFLGFITKPKGGK